MIILDSVIKCLCRKTLNKEELIPKRVIVRDLNNKVSVDNILVCNECYKNLQSIIPKQKGKHFCKICLKYVLTRNKDKHYLSKNHEKKYKYYILSMLTITESIDNK